MISFEIDNANRTGRLQAVCNLSLIQLPAAAKGLRRPWESVVAQTRAHFPRHGLSDETAPTKHRKTQFSVTQAGSSQIESGVAFGGIKIGAERGTKVRNNHRKIKDLRNEELRRV